MNYFKVIVCGGRDFDNKNLIDFILFKLRRLAREYDFELHVVQGGAKGADYLAKSWANETNTKCAEFKADWDKHQKRAGLIRNKEMLDVTHPDLVIGFEGGSGTAHMIRISKEGNFNVLDLNTPKAKIMASIMQIEAFMRQCIKESKESFV